MRFCSVLAGLLLFAATASSRDVGDEVANAPKLPEVSAMLNASAQTLNGISAQISMFNKRMKKVADGQHERLAQQKAEYESQLADQSEENQGLAAQNEKTKSFIDGLERGNSKLRSQARKLQVENGELRRALVSIQEKVGAASGYATQSLDASDDSNAKELKILAQGEKDSDVADAGDNADTAAPAEDTSSTDEDAVANTTSTEDEDADAKDEDASAQSLISLRLRTRRSHGRARRSRHDSESAVAEEADNREDDATSSDDATEEDSEDTAEQTMNETEAETGNATATGEPDGESEKLLSSLAKQLETLSREDKDSSSRMKKLFKSQLKQGEKAKAALLAKQGALNSTRTSLVKLQHDLKAAVHHLQGTQQTLEKRLHGLGEFLDKLSAYVLAPTPEAEKLLPSLPASVASFLQQHREAPLPVARPAAAAKMEPKAPLATKASPSLLARKA